MVNAAPNRAKRGVWVLIGFVAAGLLVTLGLFVWVFVQPPHDPSINHTSHPDPAATAKRYLDAIASGDADAAREIDETSFGAYPVQFTGTDLLTNKVLGAAEERITDVKVKLKGATEERASVTTSFSLRGERYVQPLFLVWNKSTESWLAEASFAAPINVSAKTGEPGSLRYLPFRVGDSAQLTQTAEADTMMGYVVYPGVYTVTVELDPATVVDIDANPLVRDVTVVPDQDLFPFIEYTVTD